MLDMSLGSLLEVRERGAELLAMSDPAWRHNRAVDLASQKIKRFDPDEDRWVVRLTEFLVRWNDQSLPDRFKSLQDDYPDLFWAVSTHLNYSKSARFHIEALVTAGMSRSDIASWSGLPLAVIAAYELCFYDIRPYLDRPGSVRLILQSRIAQRGVRDLHPDAYWKLVALESGVTGLFNLWRKSAAAADEVNMDEDRRFSSQLRRDVNAALLVREPNNFNAHEIVDEYLRLRELELRAKQISDELDATGRATVGGRFVFSLLQSVKFVMRETDDVDEDARLKEVEADATKVLYRLQGGVKEIQGDNGGAGEGGADKG